MRNSQRARVRGVVFLATVMTAVAVAGHSQTFTTLKTIYTFTGMGDGGTPVGTLVQGANGNFYGMTNSGDVNNSTVFKITPTGSLTTIYRFNATETPSSNPGLTLGNDGNFYGSFLTTSTSGPSPATFFKITPAGTLTNLYTFASAFGPGPNALVLGSDGNFYGTTGGGGSEGGGTVFKITPQGIFTDLHDFSNDFSAPGGRGPAAALAPGSDGNFYGTTGGGGTEGLGTVFKITPEATFTTLYSFTGTDGEGPSALVLGNDGNFYGTTSSGGAPDVDFGTIFRITPSGTFKKIHDFSGLDGQNTSAGLTLGKDGNFYGVSAYGGAFASGAAFQITPGGAFTSLYSFNDSYTPAAALTLASDGSFYGITDGPNVTGAGAGTVFKLSIGSIPGYLLINPNGVVNAASYSDRVAAGSIIAVFGVFPIPDPVTTSFPLPDGISGVALWFGTAPNAPIFYGSMLQINAQLPWEVSGESQTTVVAFNGQPSPPQTVMLAAYAPGIFAVNTQTTQGKILDADNQLVDAANPAIAGGNLQIYCTGLGPVTNQPATGTPALSDPLSVTTANPTVKIGGVAANVLFSGLVPGAVGLYQINVQVPVGVKPGAAVPVIASIGGATSNTVTIAIQ